MIFFLLFTKTYQKKLAGCEEGSVRGVIKGDKKRERESERFFIRCFAFSVMCVRMKRRVKKYPFRRTTQKNRGRGVGPQSAGA